MQRIITFLMLGAIGGLIIWGITEPVNWLTPGAPPGQREPDMSQGAQIVFGAIFGMVLGICIGLAQARSGMSLRDGVKTVAATTAVGLVGGIMGFYLGGVVYKFAVDSTTDGSFFSFFLLLLGRSVGWALLGCFTGLALGVGIGSPKMMVNGAIGGLIGGGMCGAGFEIIDQLVRSKVLVLMPQMTRLLAFTATCASIGLFIGFIQELTKSAWVKLLKGRNEGKEFIIYKPHTVLGRDELADIPVFGDTSVSPQHAALDQVGARYKLRDLGTPFGTSVNGNRVSEHILKDGDIIEMGSMKLIFYEKATASARRRFIQSDPVQPLQIPTSANVCPFCGGAKDASGNCSCSVGGGQAPSPPAPAASPMSDPFAVQPAPAPFPPDPFRDPASATIQQQPVPSGSAKILGMSGLYSGKAFPLKPGETAVGRDGSKDVPLSMDNTVSRNHARIIEQGGTYSVVDDGSSNGTYVNGSKITSIMLRTGDIIQFGSTKFRFEE